MTHKSLPTIQALLDAGVQKGQPTSRWNPKMKRFVFEERGGVPILDLKKTQRQIELAQELVAGVVARGDSVLFVCTRKQLRPVVEAAAERSGSFYVTERWLGGTLTNFSTLIEQVRRLRELDRGMEEGAFEYRTRKERLMLERERERLDRYLRGVKRMDRLPGALFVVGAKRESRAIDEASVLGIPVIAIAGSRADPDLLAVPIPGNDDAIHSVSVISNAIADAILEARAALPASARRAAEAEAEAEAPHPGVEPPPGPQRRPRRVRAEPDVIVRGGDLDDVVDGIVRGGAATASDDAGDGGGGRRAGQGMGGRGGTGGGGRRSRQGTGGSGGTGGGGRRSPRERRAPAPEPVLLGATAPTAARPGDAFAAELVAYVAAAEAQAREHLAQVERGAEVKMATRTGVKTGARWAPDTRVLVRLGAPGLDVQPPVQEFTWDGEWAAAGFVVTVPPDAPERTTVLAFEVFVAPDEPAAAPVRVGSLNLMLKVSAAGSAPQPQRTEGHAARTAFASYSSEDAHEVLGRVASIRTSAGLEVFLDVLTLRAGERFKPALVAAIRDADVFLLFWSRNAAASPWVEWEWRQALAFEPPARLQVHPLETATEDIPPELKDRHFRDILILAREGMAKPHR